MCIFGQERRALLFCQEDRALLCRECDIPIHRANEHTKKHNRFLLTGIKLSAAASFSGGSQSEAGKKISVANEVNFQPRSTGNCSESSSNPWRVNESSQAVNRQGSDSNSSVSKYLMETSPSWQVEDFLDPSSNYGCCKVCSVFVYFLMVVIEMAFMSKLSVANSKVPNIYLSLCLIINAYSLS